MLPEFCHGTGENFPADPEGAPLSEVKGQAVAVMGNGAGVDFNVTDAGVRKTKMLLVTVDYIGTSGAGSFDAIRYGIPFGADSRSFGQSYGRRPAP